MGTIYIDGKPYEADPQQNLLHACLSLGFDLPYFCWHPALGFGGRLPPVRRQSSSKMKRTKAGQDRDGVHDAGRA